MLTFTLLDQIRMCGVALEALQPFVSFGVYKRMVCRCSFVIQKKKVLRSPCSLDVLARTLALEHIEGCPCPDITRAEKAVCVVHLQSLHRACAHMMLGRCTHVSDRLSSSSSSSTRCGSGSGSGSSSSSGSSNGSRSSGVSSAHLVSMLVQQS